MALVAAGAWAPGQAAARPGDLVGRMSQADAIACDDPDAGPWVSAFADRVRRFNSLATFAAEQWGEAIACDAEQTTEFDGALYGTLRLTYPGGVTLEVETQPIETSIVTLRSPDAFSDPEPVRAALRGYAEGVGVSIDWEHPERADEGGRETTTTFRDPDAGSNASAVVVTEDGRLVAVRFSMAL